MRPVLSLLTASFVLAQPVAANAQQGGPDYESVVKQIVIGLDKTNKALAKIVDAESAVLVKPDLTKAVKLFVDARKQAATMRQPNLKVKDAVARKFAEQLQELTTRFRAELRRAKRIPGSADALKELDPLLKPGNSKKKPKSPK